MPPQHSNTIQRNQVHIAVGYQPCSLSAVLIYPMSTCKPLQSRKTSSSMSLGMRFLMTCSRRAARFLTLPLYLPAACKVAGQAF